MTAADLLLCWLQERGYSQHDIWCVSGKLQWIRPPKGPALFIWFKEDNTHLVVSQNMDIYADMHAKTFNIGDPELFKYLEQYFPYDTRNNSARTTSQGLD